MPNYIKIHPDGMDHESLLFGTETQLEEFGRGLTTHGQVRAIWGDLVCGFIYKFLPEPQVYFPQSKLGIN